MTGANGHPYSAGMREAPRQGEKPAKLPMVWPQMILLVGEMVLTFFAFNYLISYYKNNSLAAIAVALTMLLGILSIYQFIQCARRKACVVPINTRRGQLFVLIGVIEAGAFHGISGFLPIMIICGLFSLWAYTSLDFVKRPFNRE